MAKQRQVNARIPEDLARQVKVKAAKEDTTISEVLRKLLAKWVRDNDKDKS